MRYNISKPSAPKMPKLGKGTECIKLLLSQASKDKREPRVPMFFPTFVIYLVLRKIALLTHLEGVLWPNG